MRKWIEKLKNSRQWNIALWIAIAVFLVLSLLGIQSKQEAQKLKSIDVRIEPKEILAFLDSSKVLEIIKGGDSFRILIGVNKKDININAMENALEQYPFIEKADVSIDLSGRLQIKVMQRNPVLRIISSKGQSYYVAKNGYKMPLHPGFAPRVVIANGGIAESLTDSTFLRTSLCRDLLAIANYCAQNEFWHAQIEQIYVDNYMDILLIPKVGNHSIVFGSAANLESKFELLKTFYSKGLNVVGWDKYQRIDLRFKDQIVAGKKETIENTQINP